MMKSFIINDCMSQVQFTNLLLILAIFMHSQFCTGTHEKYGSKNLIFVILNQNAPYHTTKASDLKENLQGQALVLDVNILVKIALQDYPDVPSWIYFPLIKRLAEEDDKGSWYIFLEETCSVDLKRLYLRLIDYNEQKLWFIGDTLYDEESTIIHHYDSVDPEKRFFYPDSRTAIIISRTLLNRIALQWDAHSADFSIDASYEFSKYVSEFGASLKKEKDICIEKRDGCFVWVVNLINNCSKEERYDTELERIHFAVKTCSKLSKERVPLLQRTWLPDAGSFKLYSDVDEPEFGTVKLEVPNTDHGHCGKTLAIIHHASRMEDIDWLVIVDDDTLISVPRLHSFLSCYNPSSLLSLGERYAYRGSLETGYEYLTGGSGFILSKVAVNLLSQNGMCICPSNDSPDDMFLGFCLKKLGIPIIHSRRFHQARPADYSPSLLKKSSPISFHKFWMVDPIEIYKEWLTKSSPYSSLVYEDTVSVSDKIEL